jgi:hypothetical protein
MSGVQIHIVFLLISVISFGNITNEVKGGTLLSKKIKNQY